ncbi:hypothetical protein CHS0354_034525 [Potamilus streckersoni]|uniref:Uncharacterized protein n=1 Tax=Potamilus streckersoni TaxID=2493646 RepID=A0AAE0VUA7_9BIVA|nr:hypothetical protein CHS0354_034525 [Potamilus streckersoni]
MLFKEDGVRVCDIATDVGMMIPTVSLKQTSGLPVYYQYITSSDKVKFGIVKNIKEEKIAQTLKYRIALPHKTAYHHLSIKSIDYITTPDNTTFIIWTLKAPPKVSDPITTPGSKDHHHLNTKVSDPITTPDSKDHHHLNTKVSDPITTPRTIII